MSRTSLSVGGSDAPVIMGASLWKTRRDLVLERAGIVAPERRDSPAMFWGRELERLVIRAYVRETGFAVTYPRRSVTHPEHDWMYGHLDGLVKSPKRNARVIEAKTAGSARSWGRAWTADIPHYYMPQVQHYLACTGLEVADVPVLLAAERAGVDLTAVQEMMGHATPQTTAVYTAFDHRQARQAVSALAIEGPLDAA